MPHNMPHDESLLRVACIVPDNTIELVYQAMMDIQPVFSKPYMTDPDMREGLVHLATLLRTIQHDLEALDEFGLPASQALHLNQTVYSPWRDEKLRPELRSVHSLLRDCVRAAGQDDDRLLSKLDSVTFRMTNARDALGGIYDYVETQAKGP